MSPEVADLFAENRLQLYLSKLSGQNAEKGAENENIFSVLFLGRLDGNLPNKRREVGGELLTFLRNQSVVAWRYPNLFRNALSLFHIAKSFVSSCQYICQ